MVRAGLRLVKLVLQIANIRRSIVMLLFKQVGIVFLTCCMTKQKYFIEACIYLVTLAACCSRSEKKKQLKIDYNIRFFLDRGYTLAANTTLRIHFKIWRCWYINLLKRHAYSRSNKSFDLIDKNLSICLFILVLL